MPLCMSDSPQTPNDAPEAGARADARDWRWRPRLPVVSQLLIATALGAAILARHPVDWLDYVELTLGGLFIAASAYCGIVRATVAERRARDLHRLIIDVRNGREPVESLSTFECPPALAGLASACHDMARELRSERSRIAHLEHETRQRIANRTEALERTIGTLRLQAAKDALTGLFNRRSLDAYLPDAIARCRSAGARLAVLMVDVDHFKPLNDTLGHAAGDQMLRAVAQLIRSTIRENDVAFRNGGDEFVAVLEECDAEAARAMAGRLDSLGASLGRTFRLVPPPALSIGVAMLDAVKDADAPSLLRKADEALYQVKAAHHAGTRTTPHARKSA